MQKTIIRTAWRSHLKLLLNAGLALMGIGGLLYAHQKGLVVINIRDIGLILCLILIVLRLLKPLSFATVGA